MNFYNDEMDLEPPPPGYRRHDQPHPLQQQPAAVMRGSNVKLPPFWASSPDEWFGLAEGQFFLHGVDDERARFYLIFAALPESTARTVADLLRGPLPLDAYAQLRQRLLASHSLTEYHRMDQLHASQGLGGQRPSEMLTAMLQLCPAGESATKLFRYLFLQRLPRELRIMLSEDGVSPIAALAARADQLWSHHSFGDGRPPIAAVLDVEEGLPVAAVRQSDQRRGGRGRGRDNRRGGSNRGGGRGGGTPNASTQHQPTASDLARANTGLCHHHFTYGERAHKCVAPCSWQEN
jgi:hypothetical protein